MTMRLASGPTTSTKSVDIAVSGETFTDIQRSRPSSFMCDNALCTAASSSSTSMPTAAASANHTSGGAG